MKYILCHKNIEVLEFESIENTIVNISRIMSPEHIPVGIFSEYERGVKKESQLNSWWKNRSIPASRQNLRNALDLLGNVTTEELLNQCFGLSLSDHYWAKPLGQDIKWENINFFQNSFSEDVGKALFGQLTDTDNISLISPDNTSDGWLQKRWVINNDIRYLVKSGSGTEQQEPFNELLASEICRRLDISCVKYSVIEQNGKYYSVCPDFIDENTELINASHICRILPKANNDSVYTHFLKCCEKAGIKEIEKLENDICHMIMLDSIILNTDRHFNNFGIIRNPDSLEWIGMAPVFDSGTSMLHDISVPVLQKGYANDIEKQISKPFRKNHYEQLTKLPVSKFCKNIDFSKLNGIENFFNEQLQKNINISEERRLLLFNILKNNINSTKKIIQNPGMKKIRNRNPEWDR